MPNKYMCSFVSAKSFRSLFLAALEAIFYVARSHTSRNQIAWVVEWTPKQVSFYHTVAFDFRMSSLGLPWL